MSDYGSNERPIKADSERTKEALPNIECHSTTFRGHQLSWHHGKTFIDGVAFRGSFIEALKHISSMPKKPEPRIDLGAVKRLANAFRETWAQMDEKKKRGSV